MNKVLVLLVLYECFYIDLSSSSVSRQSSGEVKVFQAPVTYDVETSLLLNDISRKEKEVGYKIKSRLNVESVWSHPEEEYLLKFQLLGPQLHLRGKHQNADFVAHKSIWDSYSDSTFYLHWKRGLVKTLYLDQKEPVDILNYKKALSSLFQFQIIDGEYNETDISGTCNVLYESVSDNVFRKIKRWCAGEEGVSARRVARYTLAAGALQRLYADELLAVGEPGLGVKARSWHDLQAVAFPTPHADHPSLEAALLTLPADLHADSFEFTQSDENNEDEMDVSQLVELHRDVLSAGEAGGGGTAGLAAAALQLLPALRVATPQALLPLLEHPDNHPLLESLCWLLGVSGAEGAHAAAAQFLHAAAADPLPALAHAYLAGAALAPRTHPAVLAQLSRLGSEARVPEVGGAALVAAAAAASRLPPDHHSTTAVKDQILRDLHRCKDESCLWWRVSALGVLRRGDAAAALLQHAEAGPRRVALAAIRALGLLPQSELNFERRQRLENIALFGGAGRALEVRAAALDLLLTGSAALPAPLAPAAAALARHQPQDLRALYWQRLHQLADDHLSVRQFLPMLHPSLNTWDARAHNATSSVLVRETGWGGGGGSRLESVQVAAAGLLRRGAVRLLQPTTTTPNAPVAYEEELAVEVWTRGLEAIAGGGAADPHLHEAGAGEGEGEEVSGALWAGVGGVPLPPAWLFRGQAELLARVWAGAASQPTPALRALRLLPERAGALPALAGLALRYHWRAAVAIAIDAQVQVSLWSRSARGELETRVGRAGAAGVRGRAAWGALASTASVRAEPRLRVAADLDFYDGVALCVRAHTDDHYHDEESLLESEQGSRRLRVRRGVTRRRALGGRSLALGARNSAACRALAG